METLDSVQDISVEADSYRVILPKYTFNKQYLLRNGFNQLKQDMGFTQIRFYCFKKATGRVFHIATNDDFKGADVVALFTSSNTQPDACGSFTPFPDGNSTLAVNCDKWGSPANKWGHHLLLNDIRLWEQPLAWPNNIRFRFYKPYYKCDDNDAVYESSMGDIWQVYIR